MVTGNLIILSAPSGTGKTSLTKALLASVPDLTLSISPTTRPKRPSEQEGRDYHFVDEATFLSAIQADTFLEHAEVFGHYYGTETAQVQTHQQQGNDVILEIDYQGALTVKQKITDTLSIFILPPNANSLKNRLLNRNEDESSIIEKRLQGAKEELRHIQAYDYVVVNEDFDDTVLQLQHIILANRLRQSRQMAKLKASITQMEQELSSAG